jgi:hypothetical protein
MVRPVEATRPLPLDEDHAAASSLCDAHPKSVAEDEQLAKIRTELASSLLQPAEKVATSPMVKRRRGTRSDPVP